MGARGSACQNGPTCGPKGPTPLCKCMLKSVTRCNGGMRVSRVENGIDPEATRPCHGHMHTGAAVERDPAFFSLSDFLMMQGTWRFFFAQVGAHISHQHMNWRNLLRNRAGGHPEAVGPVRWSTKI